MSMTNEERWGTNKDATEDQLMQWSEDCDSRDPYLRREAREFGKEQMRISDLRQQQQYAQREAARLYKEHEKCMSRERRMIVCDPLRHEAREFSNKSAALSVLLKKESQQ